MQIPRSPWDRTRPLVTGAAASAQTGTAAHRLTGDERQRRRQHHHQPDPDEADTVTLHEHGDDEPEDPEAALRRAAVRRRLDKGRAAGR